MKSSLHSDEIFGFASDEIKSTHPPSRRISPNEVGFHRRRRFHPPARVDLVEKSTDKVDAFFCLWVTKKIFLCFVIRFRTQTDFSEIFGVAECEIILFVNCEISHFVRCEMKFASSHLRSKYFTAKLFHLAKPNFTRRKANFVEKSHLLLQMAFFLYKRYEKDIFAVFAYEFELLHNRSFLVKSFAYAHGEIIYSVNCEI